MPMRKHHLFLLAFAAATIAPFFASSLKAGADPPARIALAGQGTSAEDGRLEGVLVSARQEGSTVTITVVSDEQGRYSFPSTKIGPGRYAIKIRAVGYELD